MEDLLMIHRGDKSWELEFLGPHSQEIFDAFKTRVLPLPYTLAAKLEFVEREVRANPTNAGITILICDCTRGGR